jgi:signal transduction histidine kinase
MSVRADLLDMLRAKAMLLVRRERDLYLLAATHARTLEWYRTAYHFSEALSLVPDARSALDEWAHILVRRLRFQIAVAIELAPEGEAHDVVARAGDLKASSPVGLPRPLFDLGPADAQREAVLASALRLELSISFLLRDGRSAYLLVAGFDERVAPVKRSIDDSEREGFRMLGRHLEVMLENHVLIQDLNAERDELRLMNARLARANAELARSARQVEEVQGELARANTMAAIGRLAAGIAHELNNPLGVIAGFAQGLARRTSPSEAEYVPISNISREAKRASYLVRELLTFARTGRMSTEVRDLNTIVGTWMASIEEQVRAQGVKTKIDLAPGLPRVDVSLTRIEQVLANLTSNALDAMPAGGTLMIRTGAHDDEVEVEVSDTGVGIPEAIRAKIFDPFFTTKDVGRGTGLGLSLVYEIVSQHKGSIEIESEEGRGTTAIVRLPRATS